MAADASLGITPGILFAMAEEQRKGEEGEDAKKLAGDVATQLERKYAESMR